MTGCPDVLYKCMKFGWNTSKGYPVIERTGNSTANDQRQITPKISKAELWWFLCMTRRLNVLNKCMKFRWNISEGFQVIEQTWFCDGQIDRRMQGEKQYVSWPFQRGDIIIKHTTRLKNFIKRAEALKRKSYECLSSSVYRGWKISLKKHVSFPFGAFIV